MFDRNYDSIYNESMAWVLEYFFSIDQYSLIKYYYADGKINNINIYVYSMYKLSDFYRVAYKLPLYMMLAIFPISRPVNV